MFSSRVLFASALFLSVPAFAAPTGKMGFIGAKGAQVLNLQSSAVRSLPRGSKATNLLLSPNGTAICFVPGTKASSDALQSSPPYSSATAIAALRAHASNVFSWNTAGTQLYFSSEKSSGVYSPSTQKLTPIPLKPEGFMGAETVSVAGRQLAYTTQNSVVVRDTQSGKERVLFDIHRPAPMFAALKAAKDPKNLKDLTSMTNDPMVKEESNWQLSDPALSPDGARLYFASNAGTGYGAAGNGTFALFAVDLRTNKLAVMSKVGENFGRPPHIFRVSPDGKRLLVATSVHATAADNSCFAYVVDLQTQLWREVFNGVLPGSKLRANFLDSATWSPDGKYVALSGYFYNAEKMMTDTKGDWPDVLPSQYTAGIVDAATGRLIKTIKGATSLGWAR